VKERGTGKQISFSQKGLCSAKASQGKKGDASKNNSKGGKEPRLILLMEQYKAEEESTVKKGKDQRRPVSAPAPISFIGDGNHAAGGERKETTDIEKKKKKTQGAPKQTPCSTTKT